MATKMTDREKVNAWLDFIGEQDPGIRHAVLEECALDKGARAYFVKRWSEDCKEKYSKVAVKTKYPTEEKLCEDQGQRSGLTKKNRHYGK